MNRQGASGALGAYAITKLSSSSKSLARTAWRMLLGRWIGAMYAMVQLCGLGGEQAGEEKKGWVMRPWKWFNLVTLETPWQSEECSQGL